MKWIVVSALAAAGLLAPQRPSIAELERRSPIPPPAPKRSATPTASSYAPKTLADVARIAAAERKRARKAARRAGKACR